MQPLTGQQVGGYWIGQRLGAGAMAEVYEGQQAGQVARRVAIKVLRSEYCSYPELVERFRNEARALGRINHPGVVHIYDVADLPDQRICLIMEFLDGKTLDAWRKERGQLGVEEALPLMIQLADTMAAAHAQNIIHRDIKPENIFVISDPIMGVRTKVLDFGIAKLQSNAGSVRTQTQTTLGTAAYMAPEQFRSSKDVDHRADIYSLGCVFFELLAGRPPFVANTLVDHMRMHAFEQAPPLRSIVPTVPAEIEQIVASMLVKDPGGRYASMRQLQEDLQAVQGGGRPTGPQPIVQAPHGFGSDYSRPNQMQGQMAGMTPGGMMHPGHSGPAGYGYGPGPGQMPHGARPGSGAAERRGLLIAIIVILVVVVGVALVISLG